MVISTPSFKCKGTLYNHDYTGSSPTGACRVAHCETIESERRNGTGQ